MRNTDWMDHQLLLTIGWLFTMFAFSVAAVNSRNTDLKRLLGDVLLPQYNLMVQIKVGGW